MWTVVEAVVTMDESYPCPGDGPTERRKAARSESARPFAGPDSPRFRYLPEADYVAARPSSATRARNSLLGLNTGTGLAATSTGSPVRGFRAILVLRRRILKVPKPRTSMLCCCLSASFTASRKASTTRAQSFFEIIGPAVRAIEAVTCSTRSALVMRPPDGLHSAELGRASEPILEA